MSFYDDSDELLNFFDDFAITVTFNPDDTDEFAVLGIFDEVQELIDLAGGEIINASPELLCRTADIIGLQVNSIVDIKGTEYYVREIKEDGTGVTKITVSIN